MNNLFIARLSVDSYEERFSIKRKASSQLSQTLFVNSDAYDSSCAIRTRKGSIYYRRTK